MATRGDSAERRLILVEEDAFLRLVGIVLDPDTAQERIAAFADFFAHDEPDFPPAPGREIFMSRCTVCHTLRYITMQPNFSRKTWGKEVAKMINTFGAHITGEEARDIIDYLSTIKGLEHDLSTKVKQ